MARTFIESLRSRQDRPRESGGPEADSTDVGLASRGRPVDSKHVDDLSQHLECTWNMLMAPCAKLPMLSKKSPRVSKVKSLCTREFAVGSGLRARNMGVLDY